MGIGRFAFTPILPMMQQDAGLSVADGGWLASANYFGYLLGAMSAMAFRPRPALAIRTALVVIGIGTLGMGLERRFAAWVVLRVLAGVGSAWVLVFASAWCLARLAPVQRPFLNGAVFAGVGTGITIAGGLCRGFMQANASSAQAWGVALPGSWPAIGGIVIAALLVGGTFVVITLAGMQEARAVAGPQATRLMAGMTAACGTGQIAGPMLAGSMVGADANFSRPLLIACLILVASACALYPWPGRNGIAREEVGNGSSQKGDGEHPRRH